MPVAEIEAFAHAVGSTARSFFRLGYGFTRSRNGAVQMHAALSIPAVTGAWQHEGGGAFFNNGAIFGFDKTLPTYLGVMPRKGDGKDLRWFKAPNQNACSV